LFPEETSVTDDVVGKGKVGVTEETVSDVAPMAAAAVVMKVWVLLPDVTTIESPFPTAAPRDAIGKVVIGPLVFSAELRVIALISWIESSNVPQSGFPQTGLKFRSVPLVDPVVPGTVVFES